MVPDTWMTCQGHVGSFETAPTHILQSSKSEQYVISGGLDVEMGTYIEITFPSADSGPSAFTMLESFFYNDSIPSSRDFQAHSLGKWNSKERTEEAGIPGSKPQPEITPQTKYLIPSLCLKLCFWWNPSYDGATTKDLKDSWGCGLLLSLFNPLFNKVWSVMGGVSGLLQMK